MVSSKMAASVLKRCVTAAVKVKCLSPSLSARRWLLSAAYTDTKVWEARETEAQNLAVLAADMDRIYEKNLPVSSLTMSRFIDNISSKEEVDQTEYYLYKFRHSPNCWYLRDWTVHSWIRQCLKYESREKALHTLRNKVQYGIFPDDFTFNLLMDSYIKDKDFKSACSVVEEVMLQEAFDLPSTQILSLYALGSYLATKPQLTEAEGRALGASLLICGLQQDNTSGLSAQLLGNALLGKLEHLKGIHAVFKGMPLYWERGYLDRALAVMERVAAAPGDAKLSKDTLDNVNDLLQELSSTSTSTSAATSDTDSSGEESGGEEDKKAEAVDEKDEAEKAKLPQYISRFKELSSQLESQGKVEAASFQDLVTALAQQNLAAAETLDLEQYQSRVQAWDAEKRQLSQREKEMREKGAQEKRERLAARAAAKRKASLSVN
ncbi:small ribosomal subunit protein mS27 isoform X2 [Stegastes partitus]|uniref:Small ribosomal subunit protein mS27 n=1 Tax=Stegastes partitus TaxID=144197 RepID=A0A3B4ZY69_9TELE|nr:PREDICTED: 28S ribosomal protein S27, mitochondrial isoform X2 [Stegastes partitus]